MNYTEPCKIANVFNEAIGRSWCKITYANHIDVDVVTEHCSVTVLSLGLLTKGNIEIYFNAMEKIGAGKPRLLSGYINNQNLIAPTFQSGWALSTT